MVGMTSETLRHYDRIGLVKPSKRDEWTSYRYYTRQDIVMLNTVRALQQMDLPLQKIKAVLEVDDLQEIIEFLTAAEKKADEKIASLKHSKVFRWSCPPFWQFLQQKNNFSFFASPLLTFV